MYSIRHNSPARHVAPVKKIVEPVRRKRVMWTAERVEELRRLRLAGVSVRACAKRIGVSASAVAGFRNRNRMP